jgi:hypothetical protein
MVMPPEIIGLGEHAMHQLTQSLGIGDLHVIYLRAQREGASFRAAWIGEDFTAPSAEWFDPRYVKALFDYGQAKAGRADAWHTAPPAVRQRPGQVSRAGATGPGNPAGGARPSP